MWAETSRAWCRLKLALAELLVITVAKGDHSAMHQESVLSISNHIRTFREFYYRKDC